ncbi:MAG: hypothetical protein R2852_08805 [Bacteroidia bacterium]
MFSKSFISVLVLVILLQSGVFSILAIYSVRQHKLAVKQMMKAELKNGLHDGLLLKFSSTQLRNAHWEHSKEFILRGEKYDVVKSVNEDGEKVFYCIHDKREKELYKKLDRHNTNKASLDDLIKKFGLQFVPINREKDIALQAKPFEFSNYILNYKFDKINKYLKPPRV